MFRLLNSTMGNKMNRGNLQYEAATKKLRKEELERLQMCFRKSCNPNTETMSLTSFVREILSDSVPKPIAETLYAAFGGTSNGLPFKSLVGSLVTVTRGTQDEKVKFLFNLFADEGDEFVSTNDMVKQIREFEGSDLDSAVLTDLFKADKLSYQAFYDWAVTNKERLSILQWLLVHPPALTNHCLVPTFYQTLDGITHLGEQEIVELEQRYWSVVSVGGTSVGRLDMTRFADLVAPPLPLGIVDGLFDAFDENSDGMIDFKEMVCGISACCRGPKTERLKFCFKAFDRGSKGFLNRDDLESLISTCLHIRQVNSPGSLEMDSPELLDVEWLRDDLMRRRSVRAGGDQDGSIGLSDFLIWAVDSYLLDDFLNLLTQICHIIFGLRPSDRAEERRVVLGWLAREERAGLRPGDTWYLVAAPWWERWERWLTARHGHEVTAGSPPSPSLQTPPGRPATPLRGVDQQPVLAKFTRANNFPNGSVTELDTVDLLRRGGGDNLVATGNGHVITGSDGGQRYTGAMSDLGSATPSKASSMESSSMDESTSSGIGRGFRSWSPCPRTGEGMAGPPVRPGPVDNSSLVPKEKGQRLTSLTAEGGQLKSNQLLAQGKDFQLVPSPIWQALVRWYGSGSPVLPRHVIMDQRTKKPELELYPSVLTLYKHQKSIEPGRPGSAPGHARTGSLSDHLMSGISYATLGAANAFSYFSTTVRRVPTYTAAFSRHSTVGEVLAFLCSTLKLSTESARLWTLNSKHEVQILLEDEKWTLMELGLTGGGDLLLEVRSKDLTWPEEMSSLSNHNKSTSRLLSSPNSRVTPGLTGLNNLGNTCFMNSAIQCTSNTAPLRTYFKEGCYEFELNPKNNLGTKGQLASEYGRLMQDLWSGTQKTMAPLKLKFLIAKHAPQFSDFEQHDAQELLQVLLDGLHEDLNRVGQKPYVELRDSDGRPDYELAAEAWDNHQLRHKSIIVDLFHGLLKSRVRCGACGHESVRFDPFTCLSLPIPLEDGLALYVVVIRLNGAKPVKYGLQLCGSDSALAVKTRLSQLTGIPPEGILLVDVLPSSYIRGFVRDENRVKTLINATLYAYEVPTLHQPPQASPSSPPPSAIPKHSHGADSVSGPLSADLSSDHPILDALYRSPPEPAGSIRTDNQSPSPSAKPNPLPASSSLSPTSSGLDRRKSSGDPNCIEVQPSSAAVARSNSSVIGGPGGVSAGHARSASSASSTTSSTAQPWVDDTSKTFNYAGFTMAVPRKMDYQDSYMISYHQSRAVVFGLPFIAPADQPNGRTWTGSRLYESIWLAVQRLVAPSNGTGGATNGDDKQNSPYPFQLRAVERGARRCAWCPWFKFCVGCPLEADSTSYDLTGCFVAIDWDVKTLHLRYQHTLEKAFEEHPSVAEVEEQQARPVSLDSCLEAFTSWERLDGYNCSKCKASTSASKKMDIWRLPPILIFHLKRFQYVNGRWVKSCKVVDFESTAFDPTRYLDAARVDPTRRASVAPPPELQTVEGSDEESEPEARPSGEGISDEQDAHSDEEEPATQILSFRKPQPHAETGRGRPRPAPLPQASAASRRTRLTSGELLLSAPGHGHRLQPEFDPAMLLYDLYGIVCHFGQLGAGHYVTYARHANKKWYLYNDSNCKEVPPTEMETRQAYILFYERRGLEIPRYIPDLNGKTPVLPEDGANNGNGEFDEYRKACCTM